MTRRNPLAPHPLGGILERSPPVNPGIGARREADLLSRLPDAELAGYEGPNVVAPRTLRGARPGDVSPAPPVTFRPLAGLAENNRGAVRVVTIKGNTPGFPPVAPIDPPTGRFVVVETGPRTGDDAENIAVVCSLAAVSGDLASPMPFRVRGTITWGVGGTTFSASFDWQNGTVLVVPASYVRVEAECFANTAFFAGPVTYQIGASVAYGLPRGDGATFTSDMVSVGAAPASAVVDVPSFARSVRAVVVDTTSPPVTPNVTLRPATQNGGTVLGTFRVQSLAACESFPLPAGTRTVTVTNEAATPVDLFLVFEVAL